MSKHEPFMSHDPAGETSGISRTKGMSILNRISFRGLSTLLWALGSLISFGCRSGPGVDELRAEILSLHKKSIDAHWKKDISFFIKDISDDYFSVGNGEIRKPIKEEIRAQFSDYLKRTTFREYRNLQEPIIGFSKDDSLAWSIARVKVAGRSSRDDGSESELDFTCAWITLYERRGNEWLRLGEVSSLQSRD